MHLVTDRNGYSLKVGTRVRDYQNRWGTVISKDDCGYVRMKWPDRDYIPIRYDEGYSLRYNGLLEHHIAEIDEKWPCHMAVRIWLDCRNCRG